MLLYIIAWLETYWSVFYIDIRAQLSTVCKCVYLAKHRMPSTDYNLAADVQLESYLKEADMKPGLLMSEMYLIFTTIHQWLRW